MLAAGQNKGGTVRFPRYIASISRGTHSECFAASTLLLQSPLRGRYGRIRQYRYRISCPHSHLPFVCSSMCLSFLLHFGGIGAIVTGADGYVSQSLLEDLFGRSKTRSSEFRQPAEFGRTSFQPSKQTCQIVFDIFTTYPDHGCNHGRSDLHQHASPPASAVGLSFPKRKFTADFLSSRGQRRDRRVAFCGSPEQALVP